MSGWSKYIELREVDGETRAIRLADGRDIPIPKFPEETSETTIVTWLQYLTMDELEAARKYYMDSWNWETGKFEERYISTLLGIEIELRLNQLSRGHTTLDFVKRWMS